MANYLTEPNNLAEKKRLQFAKDLTANFSHSPAGHSLMAKNSSI